MKVGDKKDTVVNRNTLLCRLRELIEALDRRVPHLEHEGEIRIVYEAANLKRQALKRIAELDLGLTTTPAGARGDSQRLSSRSPAFEELTPSSRR